MSKKIYFASDFHLGIDAFQTSSEREKKIVRWLDAIHDDTRELYLVGDVFDHWYEYRKSVPKGFVRIFGKLAEMRDDAIPIYYFTGNHDMWMFRYVTDELGIPIYRSPIIKSIDGHQFYIGHGDGLGPGDYGYKVIKSIFNNRACQWIFGWLHPDVGLKLMRFFSVKSRQYTGEEAPFGDPDKEYLVQFAEHFLKNHEIDYFIFGHRHLPIEYLLSNGKSKYFNLGEWMYASSYGVWDGQEMKIEFYESAYPQIFGRR
ncbi:MAG: UDP-2,3-diacylglucosamine diphosphatase [Chitinophagales bacterium]|nr:UDP-2,3-diacylglucosamine diphosphatase [Chitinophagales bacterium]